MCGDLDIGTLSTKYLELMDVLRKYRIDVCIQETRLKGQSSREINGYNLWCSGMDSKCNGVRILISTKFKNNVV